MLLPPPERPTRAQTVPAGMARSTPRSTFWLGRIWYVNSTASNDTSPRSGEAGARPPLLGIEGAMSMSDSTRCADPAARVNDATVLCSDRKEPLNTGREEENNPGSEQKGRKGGV